MSKQDIFYYTVIVPLIGLGFIIALLFLCAAIIMTALFVPVYILCEIIKLFKKRKGE